MHILEGGHGVAIRLAAGEGVEIVNTHGTQVLDCWALAAEAPGEVMSMEHTRSRLSRTVPRAGDLFYSTRRRPILRFEADTSPGAHDTLLCACSPEIYAELGCAPGHRSCEGNFHEALAREGLSLGWTPGPFNLFMTTTVGPGGEILRGDPRSRPGDLAVLRAEMAAILVLSACPQDVTPINGPDRTPREVSWRRV